MSQYLISVSSPIPFNIEHDVIKQIFMLQAAFYRADVRDTCPLSRSSLRWTGTPGGHSHSQLRGFSNQVRRLKF